MLKQLDRHCGQNQFIYKASKKYRSLRLLNIRLSILQFRRLVPNPTHVKINVVDGEAMSCSCMRDSGELLSGDINPLCEKKVIAVEHIYLTSDYCYNWKFLFNV